MMSDGTSSLQKQVDLQAFVLSICSTHLAQLSVSLCNAKVIVVGESRSIKILTPGTLVSGGI